MAVDELRIAMAGRLSSNRRRWFLERAVCRRGNLLAAAAFALLLAASVADASGMSSPSKTRTLLHESGSRRPAMQRTMSGLPEKEVAPLTPQAYNEFLLAASEIKVLQVQHRLLIQEANELKRDNLELRRKLREGDLQQKTSNLELMEQNMKLRDENYEMKKNMARMQGVHVSSVSPPPNNEEEAVKSPPATSCASTAAHSLPSGVVEPTPEPGISSSIGSIFQGLMQSKAAENEARREKERLALAQAELKKLEGKMLDLEVEVRRLRLVRGDQDAILAENVLTMVELRHQHADLVRIIGDVSNKWTSTRDALDDEALDKFFVLDDAIDRLARTVEKQDERIRSSGLLASASLQPILLNGDAGGAWGEGKTGGAGGIGGGGIPALEPMPLVKGEGAGEALLGEYQRLATFRERLLEENTRLVAVRAQQVEEDARIQRIIAKLGEKDKELLLAEGGTGGLRLGSQGPPRSPRSPEYTPERSYTPTAPVGDAQNIRN